MPHKRASRLAREREKAKRGLDLAPSLPVEHEPIPKSVSRVLDAGRIRREYRKKKRQLDPVGNSDEDDLGRKKRRLDATNVKCGDTTALKIDPGESVAQFNRRVESSMMPLIKSALRQSSAQVRRVRREEAAQETLKHGKRGRGHPPPPECPQKDSDPPPMPADEGSIDRRHVPKEFETCAPRRLNDVAREPPTMRKLPRGAPKKDVPSGVLSMAQKAMMEEEREKAISHYRELKARKLREGGGQVDGSLNGILHSLGPLHSHALPV